MLCGGDGVCGGVGAVVVDVMMLRGWWKVMLVVVVPVVTLLKFVTTITCGCSPLIARTCFYVPTRRSCVLP